MSRHRYCGAVCGREVRSEQGHYWPQHYGLLWGSGTQARAHGDCQWHPVSRGTGRQAKCSQSFGLYPAFSVQAAFDTPNPDKLSQVLDPLTPLRPVDTEDWLFFRSPLLRPLTQGTGTQVFRVWPPITQLPRYLPASSGPLPHCLALSCFYSSTYFKFPQVGLPCLLKVSP